MNAPTHGTWLTALRQWLVPTTEAEFVGKPQRGWHALYSVLLALASIAVVVIHPTSAGARPLAVYMAPLVGATILFGSIMARNGRGDKMTQDFSPVIADAAVAALGVHPMLIACIGGAFLLANLRLMALSGGLFGAISNSANFTMTAVLSAWAVSPLVGHGPEWVRFAAYVVASSVISVLLMAPLCSQYGFRFFSFLKVAIAANGHDLPSDVPIAVLGSIAMVTWPYVGVVALVGPILMAKSLAKTASQRELAEARLRTDSLTGIYNRMALWDRVHEVAHSSTRASVLIGDVDFFKRLNDTHGHIEGDTALKAVAAAMAAAVREQDFVARYGGEEFGIILADVDYEEALAIGERVRIACQEALSPWGTSISLGLTMHDGSSNSPVELVQHADEALLLAKQTGKNRICVWSSGLGAHQLNCA
jgi:diguanylate cyclase (GGDEF)-like protein